jgi:SAM-dependent methyltransferase
MQRIAAEADHFFETAYDDWFAGVYDGWYKELWNYESGPFAALMNVVGNLKDLDGRTPESIRMLDCACGTGNLYIPLRDRRYDVWAADASEQMLEKTLINCREKTVPIDNLIQTPIQWTNKNRYMEFFEPNSFDLLVLMSNSFCHLPTRMIPQALGIFYSLLKPNGRLILDTKRYRRAGKIKGLPVFKELRYVEGRWVTRVDRTDPGRAVYGKSIDFHTWVHYDIDPVFEICRAIVVVTMQEPNGQRRTKVWPYCPLPAKLLAEQMKTAGFKTDVWEARKHELLRGYSYDLLIGQKATV